MSTRKDCAPLSDIAAEQLKRLRERMTFEELAALIPCSSATIWKASSGGAIARTTRFYFESRINDLVNEQAGAAA